MPKVWATPYRILLPIDLRLFEEERSEVVIMKTVKQQTRFFIKPWSEAQGS
jgi:hypothetical protein